MSNMFKALLLRRRERPYKVSTVIFLPPRQKKIVISCVLLQCPSEKIKPKSPRRSLEEKDGEGVAALGPQHGQPRMRTAPEPRGEGPGTRVLMLDNRSPSSYARTAPSQRRLSSAKSGKQLTAAKAWGCCGLPTPSPADTC